MHASAFPNLATALAAVTVHILGYLLTMVAIAWIVYTKLGLSLLRRAWFNVDLLWSVALIATGGLTLVLA